MQVFEGPGSTAGAMRSGAQFGHDDPMVYISAAAAVSVQSLSEHLLLQTVKLTSSSFEPAGPRI